MEAINVTRDVIKDTTWQNLPRYHMIEMRNQMFNHLRKHNPENRIDDLDAIIDFAKAYDLFDDLSDGKNSKEVNYLLL